MIELSYLVAAVLFILGLKQMGSPRTARRGNTLAAVGMLVATLTVLINLTEPSWTVIISGLIVGSAIGAALALRVQMTEMPELVAAFNGFGGISSMLVALVALLQTRALWDTETGVTVMLSVIIGAVTFTGSFVAYAKLKGLISGRPISLPGGKTVNAAIATSIGVLLVIGVTGDATWPYWAAVALAAVIGVLGVLPIGGADMPVVISLLNSLSGVAASTAGFVIGNDALIIGGALVGAAGMILTLQMGKAMNRTLANVLFSGFGAISGAGVTDGEEKPVNRATPDDVAIALAYAQSVLIVPGYGLAVAQAQHVTKKLASMLEERGIDVGYAIHPVAGRMPGHMNVLLAEADVPYDQLYDLDQSNPQFQQTDVVLIVGANDVVNPSARDDSTSPIYGMPILEVDRARTVVVVKRSLSPGFAGIDNPLFYMDSTMMLFSDAKAALENIATALEDL
jgi:proton-translocating NAD(P)+ transhydrogenase subunit beta